MDADGDLTVCLQRLRARRVANRHRPAASNHADYRQRLLWQELSFAVTTPACSSFVLDGTTTATSTSTRQPHQTARTFKRRCDDRADTTVTYDSTASVFHVAFATAQRPHRPAITSCPATWRHAHATFTYAERLQVGSPSRTTRVAPRRGQRRDVHPVRRRSARRLRRLDHPQQRRRGQQHSATVRTRTYLLDLDAERRQRRFHGERDSRRTAAKANVTITPVYYPNGGPVDPAGRPRRSTTRCRRLTNVGINWPQATPLRGPDRRSPACRAERPLRQLAGTPGIRPRTGINTNLLRLRDHLPWASSTTRRSSFAVTAAAP